MTDREIRIAVLREVRRRNEVDLDELIEITGERELTIRGVLSEMQLHQFVVKTTKQTMKNAVGSTETVYEFTPIAKYTIDLLEPRDGRHS